MKRYRHAIIELVIVLLLGIPVWFIAGYLDFFELLVEWSAKHERFEIDEFFTVTIYFTLALLVILIRRHINLKEHLKELKQKNLEIREATNQIRVLKQIITVCSYCRKVRGENDKWQSLDSYISEHTDSRFSHGICPTCIKHHHPELEEPVEGGEAPNQR